MSLSKLDLLNPYFGHVGGLNDQVNWKCKWRQLMNNDHQPVSLYSRPDHHGLRLPADHGQLE